MWDHAAHLEKSVSWSGATNFLSSSLSLLALGRTHGNKIVREFTANWVDLEGIMLSAISQTEKDKYCMISLIHGIWKIMENYSESRSAVFDSLWPHELYSPWNSPGQNTGVGSCSFNQGIFPIFRSNPGLPHCRRILYQLSHWGSMIIVHDMKYTNSGSHLVGKGNQWSFTTIDFIQAEKYKLRTGYV